MIDTYVISAFDDPFNCYYLALNFSVRELRAEIASARLKISTAENFRGTEFETAEDLFPWADFITCCEEAILRLQRIIPKATPGKGHIDTEKIKAIHDIVVVILQYTKLRKAGRNFTGLCPIHGDKNPSLAVYPDQQSWHCYGCQRGGDVISFIREVEGTDFKGAISILGGV